MRIEPQSETHDVLRREVPKEASRQETRKEPKPGATRDGAVSAGDDVRVDIALENRRAAASTIKDIEQARGVARDVARRVQSGPRRVLQAQAGVCPESALHLLR